MRIISFVVLICILNSESGRVAFRLDDIQDFYCNEAQVAILNIFKANNTPISIGVIGGRFGSDSKVLSAVRGAITSPTWEVEICNHGYQHEDFSQLGRETQTNLIAASNTNIRNTLNVARVKTFLPPYNLFNADLVDSIRALGFEYFSSLRTIDTIRPYYLSGQSFYRFPVGASTSRMDVTDYVGLPASTVFTQLQTQVQADDFGVIMMHPMDFSNKDNTGNSINVVNNAQLQELVNLIQLVKNAGYEIVPIHRLNSDSPPPTYGGNNMTFNQVPVAFTLFPIQDFFQTAANVAIINLFKELKTDLTVGVIGSNLGTDVGLVTYLRTVPDSTFNLEFASYGWTLSDFSTMSLAEQITALNNSKVTIATYLRNTPFSFIAPNGKYNQDTLASMRQNGFTHLSSLTSIDPPPYSNPTNNIYKFNIGNVADFSAGATAEEVLLNVKFQAVRDGFAVISLSPQTFSFDPSTVSTERIQKLRVLIQILKQSGFTITSLGRIQQLLNGQTSINTTPSSSSNTMVQPSSSSLQTSNTASTQPTSQISNSLNTQNTQTTQQSFSIESNASTFQVCLGFFVTIALFFL